MKIKSLIAIGGIMVGAEVEVLAVPLSGGSVAGYEPNGCLWTWGAGQYSVVEEEKEKREEILASSWHDQIGGSVKTLSIEFFERTKE